jgi:ABC-type polysaccharide/polyol phosphate transport system ATPase subunit
VSHGLNQISQLCDRAIWLHDGGIRAVGEPDDVIKSYVESQQDVPVKEKRKAAKNEWL